MTDNVIGGSIRFLKRIQKQQFEPEEVEVTIHFSGENLAQAEANLDFASSVAQNKVYSILGLTPPNAATPEVKLTETKKAGRPGGRKGPAEDKAPVSVEDVTAQIDAATNIPNVDVVEEDEELPLDGAAKNTKPASTTLISEEDDNADDLLTAEAAEVTDQDIQNAIVKRNGIIKNPTGIKQLLAQYVSPPGRATDIPQARRQDFLTKLAEVKPAG